LPIPNIEGSTTREEVIKAYEELGWKKTIEFDWIEINQRRGEVLINTYRFTALPCTGKTPDGACAQWDLVFVLLMPTGVIHTCAMCRRTQGPLPDEDGMLVTSRTAPDRAEVFRILRKTGQKLPVGLDRILPRGPRIKLRG